MNEIMIVPAGQDNYMYLVKSGRTAGVIDPAEARPILQLLEKHSCTLDFILITHAHQDHIGGVRELKRRSDAWVLGPDPAIPLIDEVVNDNTCLSIGEYEVSIILTPGHTSLAASYYLKEAGTEGDKKKLVFTGDTLFAGGCGRLFEGEAAVLWQSLKKIAALPKETLVYPGHEYTVDNYEFACMMMPQEQSFAEELQHARALQSAGRPTIPSTIEKECNTNIFLRAESSAAFAELRRKKDVF